MPTVDRNALCLFLRHNYIPAPYSIYENIGKLPPGTYVELGGSEVPQAYWSFSDIATQGSSHSLGDDENTILGKLEDVLGSAVELQMQADVPLGAFLSGG